MARYRLPEPGSLRQGEILMEVWEHQVAYPAVAAVEAEITGFRSYRHPLTIVVNADCDLYQDYRLRQESGFEEEFEHHKKVRYVLLCDVFTTADFTRPEGVKRQRIESNQEARYHYSDATKLDDLDVPELFVDFKKVFAIEASSLYAGISRGGIRRWAVFEPPYLQHFVQRLSSFWSRVSLPE